MTQRKPVSQPRIGISSCLLGEKVRYDGGDKQDAFILGQLSPVFELRGFCPEVAIGMGIPRPPVHLVACEDGIRARGIANPAVDITAALTDYARQIQYELAGLSGYIFKRNSPSCGTGKVKVWTGNDYESRGQGIFARAILQAIPELPVIDEQQLANEILCEQFLVNVKKYYQSNFS